MVSSPVPPMMVSTLETVPVLAPLTERQAVGAGAEVDGGGGQRRAERDRVGAVPPVTVSTLQTSACWRGCRDVRLSVPAPRSIVPPVTPRRA